MFLAQVQKVAKLQWVNSQIGDLPLSIPFKYDENKLTGKKKKKKPYNGGHICPKTVL